MNKINIEQGRLDINTHGGLPLVGSLLSNITLPMSFQNGRSNKVSDSDYIFSMLGLLSVGKSSFADISSYKNNRMFTHCLDLDKLPSEESLRQNLNRLAGHSTTFTAVSNLNSSLLKTMEYSAIPCKTGNYFPLDLDVTPLENSKSKKEGVSCTYKLFDGFAPMMAYLGRIGYLVDSEFREGKQHCQKGTAAFLESAITISNSLLPEESKILIRMDGGNDAGENIEVMFNSGSYWIVKRNLRKEPKSYWLEIAQSMGELVSDDGIERVYRGVVSHIDAKCEGEGVASDIVFEVIETYATDNGQMKMLIDIAVDTYWTNLPETPEIVIDLYHDHGTSEQFHSEFKTDMGVERLPSGSFKTNKLVFQLAMVAYNILRRISIDIVEFAPERVKSKGVKRRRIKTVLRDIINSGCQFIKKAGTVTIRFGRYCIFYRAIQTLYLRYQ